MSVRFLPSGDTGLLVEFGDRVDAAINDRVLKLYTAIRQARLPGVIEAVPTFRSLLVVYDPLSTSSSTLRHSIQTLVERELEIQSTGYLWRIPVCYEADYALDLMDVSQQTGISPEEIIELHLGRKYRVYMLGFQPGFPYMGDVAEPIRVPRRTNPRTRVPAGSVAIATFMTGIYPVESPGGWHIIGRTPIKLFDLSMEVPSVLRPGDEVIFYRISYEDFLNIKKQVDLGLYSLEGQGSGSCD